MNSDTEILAYTVKDAIRVSTIGKTRLYALIGRGVIKTTKVGRRTLVDAHSLRKLIQQGV